MHSMNKEIQEAILQEIANYKKDASQYKPYFTCMKEMSAWLSEIQK